MTWTIIAVGKLKKGAEFDLCQTYIRRCHPPIRIIEIAVKNTDNPHRQKQNEADAIAKHLPKNAVVIAMDERGETMPSVDFAHKIHSLHTRHIYFVIGGVFGLSQRIRDRATLMLSFGKMTMPHMLVRVVLCEQLYRLHTILDGHPYHK